MKSFFSKFQGKKSKGLMVGGAVAGPLLIVFALLPNMFLPTPELPADLAKRDKAILIDLDNQALYAYEKGELVKRYLAISGAKGHETPPGNYKVRTKKEQHHSREFDAPMPWTMFIIEERGIAIHAGLAIGAKWRAKKLAPGLTKSVGSHGCVGLEIWDAEQLFKWAPMFTPVMVISDENESVAQN